MPFLDRDEGSATLGGGMSLLNRARLGPSAERPFDRDEQDALRDLRTIGAAAALDAQPSSVVPAPGPQDDVDAAIENGPPFPAVPAMRIELTPEQASKSAGHVFR